MAIWQARSILLLAEFFFLTWPISVIAKDDKAGPQLHTLIDREIQTGWQSQKLEPAKLAGDAEFLRRVSLDLVGAIPTHEQVVEFLEDSTAEKRTLLVDRFLSDPRFAKHQAEYWDLILFGRNPPGGEADKRDGILRWLETQFSKNTPYDQWVRELLRAEGNSLDDGPPLYYVQYRNRPEDMSEAVTQTFLGVQLQCARCHDHPYESWKQVDFYGMAAFLARVQIVSLGKKDNLNRFVVAEKNTGDILFTGPVKEQRAGKKGEPIAPKFLHASAVEEPPLPKDFKESKFEDNKIPAPPLHSRKNQLAEWLANKDNPYFAKAIANRIWAQFMGRGLVHPVDHLSKSNPASNPELLELLTQQLVEHQFDLRWYIRELVTSETYQRSSQGGLAEPYPAAYQYGRVRPLSAEELIDSWRIATWHDRVEVTKKEPSSGRYSPLQGDYVRRFFGSPNTGTGDFQGGLQEHLYLNNGPLGTLLNPGKDSLVEWLQKSEDSLETKIDRVYLSVLTRHARPEEITRVSEFINSSSNTKNNNDPKAVRWGDVVWALMTCSEFRFNH
jgi:hypothetical protein